MKLVKIRYNNCKVIQRKIPIRKIALSQKSRIAHPYISQKRKRTGEITVIRERLERDRERPERDLSQDDDLERPERDLKNLKQTIDKMDEHCDSLSS